MWMKQEIWLKKKKKAEVQLSYWHQRRHYQLCTARSNLGKHLQQNLTVTNSFNLSVFYCTDDCNNNNLNEDYFKQNLFFSLLNLSLLTWNVFFWLGSNSLPNYFTHNWEEAHTWWHNGNKALNRKASYTKGGDDSRGRDEAGVVLVVQIGTHVQVQ